MFLAMIHFVKRYALIAVLMLVMGCNLTNSGSHLEDWQKEIQTFNNKLVGHWIQDSPSSEEGDVLIIHKTYYGGGDVTWDSDSYTYAVAYNCDWPEESDDPDFGFALHDLSGALIRIYGVEVTEDTLVLTNWNHTQGFHRE